jgi:hypothetical protein
MLRLLCVAAAAERFFAPAPVMSPLGLQLSDPPRAPAAVADLSRVEREALMQHLHLQLQGAFERLDHEADDPNAVRHFLAVLTTCFAFFIAFVAMAMKTRKTRQFYTMAESRGMRAGAQPRMAEHWSDKDYLEMWNAMRSESENTKNKVRSGPPDAVLGQAQAVYVVIFNEGTENEGVYTLQSSDDPTRTHLLTFENTEDADRFASLLQGQGLNDLGKSLMWDAAKTTEYCNSCEYAVTHVPVGTMFTPPRNNSIDEDAFRVRRELMRQAESMGMFGDERPAVDGMLGLDTYQRERAMFERIFNDFSP